MARSIKHGKTMQVGNQKKQLLYRYLCVLTMSLVACGKGSDSASSGGDPLGAYLTTLSGSISSHSGSQKELAGWAIALIDRDSQIASIASIDQAGLFSFSRTYLSLEYTLALFSPSLVLRAVLAQPASSGSDLHPYFRIKEGTLALPRLVSKGLTLSWQDLAGLELGQATVADANFDGVPEGVYESLAGGATSLTLAQTKEEAQAAAKKADLNENGLINSLDHNNDGDLDELGNPLYDDFDTDANGDLIPDLQQNSGEAYFPRGAQWIMVQYEMSPTSTQGVFKRQMTFTLKLHPDLKEKPQSVRIRRDPSLPLLQDATVSTATDTPSLAWDGLLLDAGQTEDSGANDGIYAMKVTLKAGSVPNANQAIAFQIVHEGWTQEFIYLLAPVFPLPIRPSYETVTRSVTFKTAEDDQPFGNHLNFVWIVGVFAEQKDGTWTQVYNSQPIAAKEKSLVLPANVMEGDANYSYKVIAQSQERVGGYATYKIESKLLPLE